ncbi:Mg2+ transporter protein, CorA-like/Zinc transport protein ZntB [Penicillium expansum]|nr:Mg2+ transporter protein, CorA-like/Zinc transport protein ZntB [Penicillium expansum]
MVQSHHRPRARAKKHHHLSEEPLLVDTIQSLKSKLPNALTEGPVQDIKDLIQSHAALSLRIDYDCPAYDDYSRTDIPLLHIASAFGPPEIVRLLLELGANIKETTEAGSTVLHLAARNGKNENLKILFEHGAKALVNVKMRGQRSPLNQAAWTGQTETCKTLIAQGADTGLKDVDGRTALIFAADLGHLGVIKTLLDAGANVNDVCNAHWTALHFAAKKNRPEAIKLLLTRGADSTLQEGDIGNPLHLAAMEGCKDATVELLSQAPNHDINAKNVWGNTALHLAARYGQPHIVQKLIEHGADKDFLNNDLSTPLHIACSERKLDVAKVLVQNHSLIDEYNRQGNTPLQLVASNGEAEIVLLLLNSKADVDTNNKIGNTSIQLASANGHHKVVQILLDHNAAVGTRNNQQSTPLHLASANGHIEVMLVLLAHKASLTKVDEDGSTPLHLASDHGQADAVDLLIDRNAGINAKTYKETTALHMAAHNGHRKVVELLLRRGAEVDPVDCNGDTPLHQACVQKKTAVMDYLIAQGANIHQPNTGTSKRTPFAIACSESSLRPFMPLLKVRDGLLQTDPDGWSALHYASWDGASLSVKELLEDTDIDPSICTHNGQSALRLAIDKGHVEIVLELLNSQPYYPETPVDSCPCPTAESEIQIIAEGLAKLLVPTDFELGDRLTAIMYWAIVNGQSCLIDRFLTMRQGEHPQLKRGMTCLHVAAQHGQEELAKSRFCHLDPFTKTDDGFTSFQVAAASGHRGILESLLGRFSQSPKSQIEAIIMKSNERESCVSLAVKKRNTEIKGLLWSKLDSLAIKKSEFYLENPNQASQILELAAQFEKPGKEDYLQRMFETWFEGPSHNLNGHTVLHLAIYHRQVVVLWWLLSNGAHFKTEEIQLAHDMLHRNTGSLNTLMTELIHNPPPIVEYTTITESDQPPARPTKSDSLTVLQELPVTIIDFYGNKTIADLHHTTRSVKELIYQTSGPNEIMQSSMRKGHRQLDFLKQDLANMISGQSGDGSTVLAPHKMDLNSDHHAQSDPPTVLGELKFRWLHVPANQIPFLSIGKFIPQFENDEKHGVQQVNSQKGDQAIYQFPSPQEALHEAMTLDQYFYPTEDTYKRDSDQVVSKYLDRVKGEPNKSSKGNQNTKPPDAPSGESSERTILMVDQLWMWIIDGRTIITTSTKSSDQHDDILSAGIREFVMSNQSKSTLERVSSVESMIEVILGVATGLFLDRNIPTGRMSTVKKREKKSTLEIFRESIRTIADAETKLFNEFLTELNKEKGKPKENNRRLLALDMAENPYHIVSKEAELLNEIKDIHDELNMLRTLAESQQNVWEQFFQTKELESFPDFQFSETCTPNMVLRDIQNMMTETEMVQNSINTLLDLRTNQAGLKEAEFGRQQAYDTARQANVIFVFTIVTIIFLPLSFLCSLFALNVAEFPRVSGAVEYHAWWIFPILFGVSGAVSLPLILLAFNFDNLVKQWNRMKHETKKKNGNSNGSETASVSQSNSTDERGASIQGSSSQEEISGLPKSVLSLINHGFRQRRSPQNIC